ncbi:MAG: AI-2E family transporter [Candidatus Binataceae bacterium]
MEREHIMRAFFFAFMALMAYELYQVFYPFLTPIAWAILLAFLAHPALAHLDRLIKHRTISAAVLTAMVALLVILPAIWLSGRLVSEAQHLYAAVSGLSLNGGASRMTQWFAGTRAGAAISLSLSRHGMRLDNELRGLAVDGAKALSAYVIAHGETAASNFAAFVFHFVVMLLTLFYMLRDGETYYEGLRELTPLHERDKATVFDTLRTTLSAVMRGLMLTALLDGVSIGLAYLVCGVPYWAFLGIVTAAAGLLPVGGTALVWVPVAIYLGVKVGWSAAVGLAIWALLALLIIDNFIKPVAMKHGTSLPTLALFFGLAGGIEVYGPLGLFAGPAVIAIFAALLRVYRRTYMGEDEPIPRAADAAPPRRWRRRGRQ